MEHIHIKKEKLGYLMFEKNFKWSKVPTIGLLFWLTKLVSTGQGESISDWSTKLFGLQNIVIGAAFTVVWSFSLFAVFLYLQLRSEKYRPFFYWMSVALLAIFGTVLADGLTAVFGLSHMITSIIFGALMLLSFYLWHHTTGSLSIHNIKNIKSELFYWITVMFSFALGTAVGDWFAYGKTLDPYGFGLGLLNTGLLLGAIFVLIIAYRIIVKPAENSFSEILTFWLAYILTRPVGASFADYFGYDWKSGSLGNRGMSVIWLMIFIVLMAITFIRYSKSKSEILSVSHEL
ncbi:hypothetical protein [Lactococcus fujiensis]|uniref:Membrane-anchored protein n=2 Tax=Lactococcus fujiensis TaxID=610251 RepID=A0A2A5RLS0_9LACT|nr:hypothetical protein [Lactococcus fujiensis]PCS00211.1 hypothetical protein RT41_GL001522 [Lactococcus fujiensis JCM 16395]